MITNRKGCKDKKKWRAVSLPVFSIRHARQKSYYVINLDDN